MIDENSTYAVVSPDGTTPIWGVDDSRFLIVLDDKVLAYVAQYDFDAGTAYERLMLLGTTTTAADAETIFAERSFPLYGSELSDETHTFDLVNYGGKVAAIGTNTIWEVDSSAVQTIVPIVESLRGRPITHVSNLDQATLRTYDYSFALYGPEDGQAWSAPVTGRQDMPVWHGIVDLEYPSVASFEDLPPDPPFEVPVRLDAVDGVFNFTYDPEIPALPFEFWSSPATFHYTWRAGMPSVAGSVETRLYVTSGGSGGPVAGDGMTSTLEDSADICDAAYRAVLSDGSAMYLHFYVTPPDGPGYQTDLSSEISEAWIDGHYTVTPSSPWREEYTRSEYEFRPASDLRVTSPDMSSWGAPTAGGATETPTINSWRGISQFWTVVGALREVTHYPDGGFSDEAYYVNKFTIATRWDDPAQTSIDGAFDLARCRFARAKRVGQR